MNYTDRPSPEALRVIGQDSLDVTGRALLTGDFDLFASHFRPPMAFVTPQNVRLLHDYDGLRGVFDSVSTYLRDSGVTRLDRVTQDVRLDEVGTFHHTFVSRLFVGNELVRGPFTSLSRLILDDGHWKVVESCQTLVSEGSAHEALMVTDRGAAETPGGTDAARAVMQAHLDAVSQAYMAGEVEAFLRQMQLPLFKQGVQGAQIFTDTQVLRRDFDDYRQQFQRYGVTDLVRTVKAADFLDDQRIHGTCRTHVLSGTQLLVPSYVSAITLQRDDHALWRLSTIMHPMGRLTMDLIVNAGPQQGGTHRPLGRLQ